MNVLVTGGAGYIGSHTVLRLVQDGHFVFVVDSLNKGHREALPKSVPLLVAQLSEVERISKWLMNLRIESIIHFAALSEVSEGQINPQRFYARNVSDSLSLLSLALKHNIKRIIFSSTAAVYGQPQEVPISEEHPTQPINTYGRTKLMVETILEDFRRAYGIGYTILRYFNAAGADPSGQIGEDHRPESHLIPNILKSALAKKEIGVFGTDYATPDGSAVRDYIHVMDLAEAHVLALLATQANERRVYNLGSERGFSVLEVIKNCEAVLAQPILIKREARRLGDPPILVASAKKIKKELGWAPKRTELKTIISDAWKWHKSHPQGFQSRIEPKLPLKTTRHQLDNHSSGHLST